MRYGGEGNRPVLHGWASCIDYITGYSATYGAVLALLKRRRSGVPDGGDFVTTSLAQGGQLVQAPFMYACEAGCSGDEPSGQDAVGEHALHRMYRAPGWLGFSGWVGSMRWISLRCVAGLENAPDEDAGEFLEDEIKKTRCRSIGLKFLTRWGLAGGTALILWKIFARCFCTRCVTMIWRHGTMGGLFLLFVLRDHPAGSAVDLAAARLCAFEETRLFSCSTLVPNRGRIRGRFSGNWVMIAIMLTV